MGGAPPRSENDGPGVRVALLVYALLTLGMFADVLVAGGNVVLGSGQTDMIQQFIHWRRFGFDELAKGNLALWNPHVFCGAPYHGGFQSALLYPPNLLYLVLPLTRAINVGIALHVFLAGLFTFLWVRRRGFHGLAALLAGGVYMFCSAHFLHVYAGHLANLCTLVWAPLIFLSIDGTRDRPSLPWMLTGGFAVAMTILAGHPQYAFFTAIAAGIYAAVRLVHAPARWKTARALAVMVLGGLCLSAAQILPALVASAETIRSEGLTWTMASMIYLPPENLLTAAAPGFFGEFEGSTYWGRWIPWETSLFVGVTALALAVIGLLRRDRPCRWLDLGMIAALLVLALGRVTPLHRVLYDFVPGFDRFRGIGKFVFLISLFLAMSAAAGLDRIVRGGPIRRRGALIVGAIAVAALAGGLAIRRASGDGDAAGWWRSVVLAVYETGDTYLEPENLDPAKNLAIRAGESASLSLLIAGGTALVVAALLLVRRRRLAVPIALSVLAVLEVFTYARIHRATFDIEKARQPGLDAAMRRAPPDMRSLSPLYGNYALTLGTSDLWGTDPGIPTRYAEFMAFSQGANPDEASQYVSFAKIHPLYAMLRLRVFATIHEGRLGWFENPGGMPRVNLVSKCVVVGGRDEAFAVMSRDDFNPWKTVVLESSPDPMPVRSGSPGTVRVIDESTDHLTIDVHARQPSILLITDSYAESWRARGLPGSAREHYEVMPANHTLRGIPLTRGRHRIRLEYVPAGYAASCWISGLSAIAFLAALGLVYRRSRRSSI